MALIRYEKSIRGEFLGVDALPKAGSDHVFNDTSEEEVIRPVVSAGVEVLEKGPEDEESLIGSPIIQEAVPKS